MKTILFSAISLLLFFPARSLSQTYDLPAGALIVETRNLPAKVHANRALILWMINPTKNPRAVPGEIYMCPEETRGHYYSGPTRVSLVDTKTRRVINTLKIIESYMDDDSASEDSFDIPYKIHQGYYHVRGVRGGREGVPVIMWLRDYNDDGRALEFALFDAQACMGLATTLIGYSESKDRVIQYPVELEVIEGVKRSRRTTYWPDYLFSRKSLLTGLWKYNVDYSGRGGTLDKWEIFYNRQRERFEGTLTRIYGAKIEQQY